jgi:site-specific DNA-methyltransferase (adenine-specific)
MSESLGAFNEPAFAKYAGSPDNVIACGFSPGEAGLHPTQKPVKLMQALIELTTQKGQIVLDPFCGSGTTLAAARNVERRCLGFESNIEFVEIARRRLEEDLFAAVKPGL